MQPTQKAARLISNVRHNGEILELREFFMYKLKPSFVNYFILLVMSILVFPSVSFSAADTSPPSLQNLSFAPSEVNLSSGAQVVTVDVTVQDETGVDYIYVRLKNPSGSVWKANSYYPGTPSASVSWDVSIPELSPGGIYSIEYITLRDSAGNTIRYYPNNIQTLGLPTSFSICHKITFTFFARFGCIA